MYAVGLSPLVGMNVVKTHFPDVEPECGEFFLKSKNGKDLPMGTFLRFSK
jgi:23S rRNA (cytosine1962-C5)-methyltransferase